MTHSQRLLVAVAVALVAGGCVGDRATGPRPPQNAAQQPGLPVLSRNGILVPQAQMRSRLAAITRDVAIALADPQLRATVYSELRGSPYREHKIYFGGFLRNSGRSLLNALAGLRQGTTAGVLATLDSVVDLEFYMPVPAHFIAWDGGPRLLVAGAVADHTTPVGFDLRGRPVTLSAETPPETPTLVVVPVETDFSRMPAFWGPRAPTAAVTTTPGVYMTYQTVYDDHEGWFMGGPEFEVHTFVTNANGQFVDVACAGEEQSPPYQYNNDGTWSGEVLLATEAAVGDSNKAQFQVWEDDTGGCTSTGGRPPRTDDPTMQQLAGWASSLITSAVTILTDKSPYKKLAAALAIVPVMYNIITALNKDDMVGVFVLPDNCWYHTSGEETFEIREPGGNHALAGWGTLDFRFGNERTPVCEQPPPPPPPPPPTSLSVTISGPSPVPAYTSCPFVGGASNGVEPYTFEWFVDGSPVGDGSNPLYYANSGSSFTVQLGVTDANGLTGFGQMTVTVDPGMQSCNIQ